MQKRLAIGRGVKFSLKKTGGGGSTNVKTFKPITWLFTYPFEAVLVFGAT